MLSRREEAAQLGVELGRLDHDARNLPLCKGTGDTSNYALARGYLAACIKNIRKRLMP